MGPRVGGWVGGLMGGCVGRWVDGWVGGLMGGWVGGCMVVPGWVHGGPRVGGWIGKQCQGSCSPSWYPNGNRAGPKFWTASCIEL